METYLYEFILNKEISFLNIQIILGYRFDKPDSMNDEKLKKQLQYHIAARQGPMTGLSSKWDYETG